MPRPVQQEPATFDQHDPTTNPDTPSPKTDLTRAPVLSETGEYSSPEPAPAPTAEARAQAVSAASSSAAKGGSPADDLLASYHAALRARIAKTWPMKTAYNWKLPL
jgi:hypothetical protein